MGPLLQAPSGGLQRTAWVVAIAVASGVVAPAGSQSVPARSMLAYTQSYCECTAACNAFCASPNASLITTPSGQSTGPSDHSPSWSPDAARIAFVRAADIVVMDVVSGTLANLTNTESVEYAPAWSPDGRRIAFVGDSDAQPALHLMNADGTGVVPLPAGAGFPSWSRLTFSPDRTALDSTAR